MIRAIRNFIRDYWRLMVGKPLIGFEHEHETVEKSWDRIAKEVGNRRRS